MYKYTKSVVCFNHLVLGRTSVDVSGQFTIECQATSTFCHVVFKENGFFDKNVARDVEGEIKSNGANCFSISGKWNEYIKATDLRDKSTVTVWTRKHIPNKDYYYFN